MANQCMTITRLPKLGSPMECICVKRNGLQDSCTLRECRGSRRCLTLPDASCEPALAFYRKLACTDHSTRKQFKRMKACCGPCEPPMPPCPMYMPELPCCDPCSGPAMPSRNVFKPQCPPSGYNPCVEPYGPCGPCPPCNHYAPCNPCSWQPYCIY